MCLTTDIWLAVSKFDVVTVNLLLPNKKLVAYIFLKKFYAVRVFVKFPKAWRWSKLVLDCHKIPDTDPSYHSQQPLFQQICLEINHWGSLFLLYLFLAVCCPWTWPRWPWGSRKTSNISTFTCTFYNICSNNFAQKSSLNILMLMWKY